MSTNRQIINNKEKQAASRAWSADKFTKRHTRIPDPLIPEKPNYRSRKEKTKKRYAIPFLHCPFCSEELQIKTEAKNKRFLFFNDRELFCRACGAKEVEKCPACKRPTWINKEGFYKHKLCGCGFYGKKKL